jgi:hypothetical protein
MNATTNSGSVGSALYYPYIHPRNVDRLKSALMYWDRVRRIVPREVTEGAYADGDNDDARLLADNGLLLSTPPEGYKDRAFERFVQHIEPHQDRFRIEADEAVDLANRNYGLHVEKMGDEAIYRLEQMGLAVQVGDWVAMNAQTGAFFMFCLAATMGSEIDAPLLSEEEDDGSLGQSILFEPENTDDASEWLIQLGIDLPTPDELAKVSTADFVSFANRRAAERLRFRQAIDGIIEVAREIDDPNLLADYVSSRRIELNEAFNSLKASLDEIRVEGVANAAKICVPSGIGGLLALSPLGGPAVAILAAVGVVVAGISCYATTRGKLRKARQACPYHYLISMEGLVHRPLVEETDS